MRQICLISKYSTHSKTLVDIMKKNKLNFTYICIDNHIVRRKILNNGYIKINYVPCLLLIKDTGIVEKYEGEHSLQWVQNNIQQDNLTFQILGQNCPGIWT